MKISIDLRYFVGFIIKMKISGNSEKFITNDDYIKKELPLFEDLYFREKWLLGERLGRDPSESEIDLIELNMIIAKIILDGFGEMAQIKTTKGGKNE